MYSGTLDRQQATEASPTIWRLWGLVKQELLFICWALMDVAIITPFALLLMRWTQFWDVGQLTLWLLLLILAPFNLIRLMSTLGVSRSMQWRILFVLLVAVLFISWRGLLYAPRPISDLTWLTEFFGHLGKLGSSSWGRDFVVFLFVFIAFWRGLSLAQLTPDIRQAGFRLRFGVLLLAPLALILYAIGNLWGATPFVLLYFLAGLTAVALIRAEQIERERSGFAASLTPRWVGTIFIASLLVVLTAGFAGAIMSGNAASILAGRLAPLWTALMATLAVSLSTAIYLLSPLLNLLALLITLLSNLLAQLFALASIPLDPQVAQNQGALQTFNDLIGETNRSALALPPTLIQVATGIIMVTAALLMVFFITRRFRQPAAGERPSIGTAQANKSIAQPGIADRILRRMGLLRRWRAAASIRRIYEAMCQAAAGAGYPRAASETPYEYLASLEEVWPRGQVECRLITSAFVRIRYGELPETEGELRDIQDAWRRLSTQPAAGDAD